MVRLVWYALLVGLACAFAQHAWTANALDGSSAASTFHDVAPYYIGVATVVLAIFSRLWRAGGALLLGALIGAIITAPYAIAYNLAGTY